MGFSRSSLWNHGGLDSLSDDIYFPSIILAVWVFGSSIFHDVRSFLDRIFGSWLNTVDAQTNKVLRYLIIIVFVGNYSVVFPVQFCISFQKWIRVCLIAQCSQLELISSFLLEPNRNLEFFPNCVLFPSLLTFILVHL